MQQSIWISQLYSFYCDTVLTLIFKMLETLYSKKRVHLGNTSIYRSQQGAISDSPIFERIGEVSRFSFSNCWQNFVTDKQTPDEQCQIWGLVLCTAQKWWGNETKFDRENKCGEKYCWYFSGGSNSFTKLKSELSIIF